MHPGCVGSSLVESRSGRSYRLAGTSLGARVVPAREDHKERGFGAAWSAARRGCDPHDEVKKTRGDLVGIEVTMESLACRPGGLQSLRLGADKIHHFRRRPDRIVERPIPPFDAVVKQFWNWARYFPPRREGRPPSPRRSPDRMTRSTNRGRRPDSQEEVPERRCEIPVSGPGRLGPAN